MLGCGVEGPSFWVREASDERFRIMGADGGRRLCISGAGEAAAERKSREEARRVRLRGGVSCFDDVESEVEERDEERVRTEWGVDEMEREPECGSIL